MAGPKRGGRAASPRPRRGSGAAGKPNAPKPSTKKRTSGAPSAQKASEQPEHTAARSEPGRSFRLGVVPGTTPGKWINVWRDRMPHIPLDLIPLAMAEQRDALTSGAVDAALIRLPIDTDGMHVIRLYDDAPVVVASADSHLLAADELTLDDLRGETLIVPGDNVLGSMDIPGTVSPRFATLQETADAVATASSGVGIVILPMSLARLHHRKDADYRPLTDGPVSPVAVAWLQDHTTEDVETFVGIVRGRTANSSR